MGTLLGMLGVADTDASFLSKLGQQVVYDAVTEYLRMHNMEMAKVESVFVEKTTEDFQIRYKLIETGYMERQGGVGQASASGANGAWDVAFPIDDWGRNILINDVALARMAAGEFEKHIDGKRAQDINTRRREMLRALFRNTSLSFVDDVQGTLTVRPLANGSGDSVVYPPVLGSTSEATRQRYNVSTYTSASISATNNPLITIRQDLEADFGTSTGYANVAAFFNKAQIAKLEALAGYRPVEDINVRSGQDTDVPINLPSVPGVIRGRCDGCWIIEWAWIPADYALGIHLDAPRPLIKRVDPAAVRSALGIDGLTLVAENRNSPLFTSKFRNRYGFGVGNRLNGYVMQFKASGSYDIPTVG